MLRDPVAPIDGVSGAVAGGGGGGGNNNAPKKERPNGAMIARLSNANLSSKHIIDKRFNKMLFNMHGIPVQPNVTNQQQKKKQKEVQKEQDKHEKQNKGNRKRKQVVEHHV